ncbi:putative disease resistance protein At1g50180 [Magnolia sinica]|uniref:putative disease resistance protein At1g50180 n=1 Tax=Magnolia sinica TaxID=86752 RepID=UPI00265A1AD7|nr:putative disease resistance protein At1g50180 [Magnolia sinica]XP_058115158.1 putative disease resistance protein At1g50180 [Magnolia sinica]
MAIVESIVEHLLQSLADPLIQEARFLCGVGGQVEWLDGEFKRMKCFLKDAAAKQDGNEGVKNWVQSVSDVAYDAEDAIDTFLFRVAPLRRKGFVGRVRRYAFIIIELIALHKVGSEIERIKNKIREISESRSTYGIESIDQGAGMRYTGVSIREWRLTSPLAQEPDFVGFEKDLDELVVRLTDGEPRRCVVSVVGMGGLGKTTLTKKLYNTDTVKKHFDSHAWISVSQEFSVRDLLQAVIKTCMVLSKEELEVVEKADIIRLQYKLSMYLKEKKYLVVLDDIWTNDTWDVLKDAFPDIKNGSRVILTTRKKDVALHADAQSPPHELRFLNDEESWELFCKKAFPGRVDGCPPDLEELGRDIVEKLHCLPLAIVVLGGLLSRKETTDWEKVRKSISWQCVKGEDKISRILSLSYKDLPYYLKPCFLYLGNFPEDYEFHYMELIQMWTAEGFLEERGEETLEEVGEDCLKELIQRSMVQVASRSSSGGIKSCRIHDLLRDLSIVEAKEGKFLEVHRGNANSPALQPLTARRLAIQHDDLSTYISLSRSTSHLRSVLMYTQGSTGLQSEQEMFLYRGFELLRVLYLHGVEIDELPKEIGKLIHLRYLRCTKTELKSLPSSIGNLPNLQTLCIASPNNIKVPSTILKMQQLRHLQVKYVFDEVHYLGWFGTWGMIQGHSRLKQMSNLQTLAYVMAGEWLHGCVGMLTNLRKLGICLDLEGVYDDVLYESIEKMVRLQSLTLVTRYPFPLSVPFTRLRKLRKLRLEVKLNKLPEFHEFPTNLTKLTLKNTFLEQDAMATLEKLKNLRILRLYGSSYWGKEMACSAQGFPRLEFFYIKELFQLEEWRLGEGAMRSLLNLQIWDCPQMKKLPEGLQHVTTLEKLELWSMSDEFNGRLEEDDGEDWHKFKHIPSIDIRY